MAWGGMNDNLPTFVVLPDSRGFAPNGPGNWTAGFLPATHQGTMIRASAANPIAGIYFHPRSARFINRASEAAGLDVLKQLNRQHEADRTGDSQLEARIHSYELAAKLQTSAPEVLDLSGESARTLARYGLDLPITEDFGRNCLVARRLLERGVRFVQVWSGADNGFPRRNWDSHEDIARDHETMAREHGSPGGRAAHGLEGARPAGRYHRYLDHRVRPHAMQPRNKGARSQSLHVHKLAGRRRNSRRRHARRQRRVVVQSG